MKTPFKAVERRVEGATLERPPLRARQSGVRTAETITTSLGDLGVGFTVMMMMFNNLIKVAISFQIYRYAQ